MIIFLLYYIFRQRNLDFRYGNPSFMLHGNYAGFCILKSINQFSFFLFLLNTLLILVLIFQLYI